MPTVKTEKETYNKISRYDLEGTINISEKGERTVENLDRLFELGCLQRIAIAQESIASTLKSINSTLSIDLPSIAASSKDIPGRYELLKQVTKLSARLKAAGLDGDPKSDNRGRPRNGKTKGH